MHTYECYLPTYERLYTHVPMYKHTYIHMNAFLPHFTDITMNCNPTVNYIHAYVCTNERLYTYVHTYE
jgi:hypothetical protein